MFSLVVIALLGWCACASSSVATYYSLDNAEQYFDFFMQEYNKVYDSEYEKQTRFEIFKTNLIKVNELNSKSKSAVFGITKFSDLTQAEFRSTHTAVYDGLGEFVACPSGNVPSLMTTTPDSYDWRDHGVVSRVKQQGDCGSCWAFSTTGNIESQYAIKHQQVLELSEQQIIDCETTNSYMCIGGFVATGLQMLMQQGGSELEQDYPYTAENGTCHFDASRVAVKVTGCNTYESISEDDLKNLVYQHGPVSVSLQADYLKHYQGGIIDAETCNTGEVDHAVLVVGYGIGITKFSDLTQAEFRSTHTAVYDGLGEFVACPSGNVPSLMTTTPDSYDWRDHGVVSRVKQQGDCGSCWAFSTTGNIESQYAIKHQQVLELSEQQIIDCETTNSYMCIGGFVATGLQMLMQQGGSELEQDYPYTAENGTCHFDASRVAVKVTGCNTYESISEDDLKNLVYQHGPVSVSLQADYLKHYQGGIIDAETCNTGEVDHAVLVVGYGIGDGTPFWIVKNSWGPNWGEQGYYRIERGTNACQLMNIQITTSDVA